MLEFYKDKKIIPCKKDTKISIIKNWSFSSKRVDIRNYLGKGYNLAWVLESEDFIIDIDTKTDSEAIENAKRFCEDIGIKYEPNVKTPNNGYHIYLKKEKDIKVKKYLKEYPGVEFKTKGTYVLIPDSKIKEKEYEFLTNKVTALSREENRKIEELFNQESIPKYNKEPYLSKEKEYNSSKEKKISENEVWDLLECLDSDMEYPEWIKVGFALNDWDSGGLTGFRMWETWSRRGSKYNKNKPGYMEELYFRMRSGSGKEVVTIGTLKYLSGQNKIPKLYIKKEEKEEVDYKKEEEKEVVKGRAWYENWAYTSFPREAYVNLENLELFNKVAFDRENYKYIEKQKDKNGKENRLLPSQYLTLKSDVIELKRVVGEEYNPKEKEGIFKDRFGRYILNLYKKKWFPEVPEKMTMLGKECVDFFKNHCNFITGGCGNVLLDYIAHIIQRHGERIGWFVLLGSTMQGIGKTFVLNMVSKMLGSNNCKLASAESLQSQFNTWADARLFLGINEFYMPSSNRKVLQNRLKSVVTDSTVVLNSKYKNEREVKMFANGIFCTNYADCVADLESDRRLFYSFLDIKTKEEFEESTGYILEDYNKKIGLCLENYKYILKYFKEEHIISKDFNIDKRPPISVARIARVQQEKASIKGYSEAMDLINYDTCFKWNNDYIILKDMITKLREDGIDITNYESIKLKDRLGYSIGGVLQFRRFDNNGNRVNYRAYFKKILSNIKMNEIVKSYEGDENEEEEEEEENNI